MRHGRSLTRGLAGGAAASVVLSLGAAMFSMEAADAAAAQSIACGAVVTTDLVLERDLLGCPADGLVVGASGITIDLNGHTIEGDGVDEEGGVEDHGVRMGRFDDVEVRGGTVRSFYTGISLFGTTHATVEQVSIEEVHAGIALIGAQFNQVRDVALSNGFDGILLGDSDNNRVVRSSFVDHASSAVALVNGSDNNRVRRNDIEGNGYAGVTMDNTTGNRVSGNDVRQSPVGILIFDSASTLVRRNRTDRNGVGIGFVGTSGGSMERNIVTASERGGIHVTSGTTGALLLENVVTGSVEEGILVSSPRNTLTRNRADANGDEGIEAVPGTIDGGGNRAQGNAAAEQCVGIVCR